jgi:hypothetical protein
MAVGNKKISPTKRRFFKYMSNKPPKDFSELNIKKKAFRGIIQRLCGDVNEKNRFFWKIGNINKKRYENVLIFVKWMIFVY